VLAILHQNNKLYKQKQEKQKVTN